MLSAEDMIPGGVFSFDVAFWPCRVCETKSFIKYSKSIKNSECILYMSSWCLTSRLYFPPCLKTAERAYTTETPVEGSTSPCQGLCVYIKKEGSFLQEVPFQHFLLTFKGTPLVKQCLWEAITMCSKGWIIVGIAIWVHHSPSDMSTTEDMRISKTISSCVPLLHVLLLMIITGSV